MTTWHTTAMQPILGHIETIAICELDLDYQQLSQTEVAYKFLNPSHHAEKHY